MSYPNPDPFAQNPYTQNPYRAVGGQTFSGGPTNAIRGMQQPFSYPNNNPRSVARPSASSGGATSLDTSIPTTRYGSPLPFNPVTNNFSAHYAMSGGLAAQAARGGGGGGTGGGSGGGFSGSMGEHSNQKWNPTGGDFGKGGWQPVKISADPSTFEKNQTSNANPDMGSVQNWHDLNPNGPDAFGQTGSGPHSWEQDPWDPARSQAFWQRAGLDTTPNGRDATPTEAAMLPQNTGTAPTNAPPPLEAYGGTVMHRAIVGDPQADGGPNPELVEAYGPIRVTPLRNMPQRQAHASWARLPHYDQGGTTGASDDTFDDADGNDDDGTADVVPPAPQVFSDATELPSPSFSDNDDEVPLPMASPDIHANADSYLQPSAPKSGGGSQNVTPPGYPPPNYLRIPTEGDPVPPLTPEEQTNQDAWNDVLHKLHDLKQVDHPTLPQTPMPHFMSNPAEDIHWDPDSPIPPPAPDSFHNTTALPGPDSTANLPPQAAPMPPAKPTTGMNPVARASSAPTVPPASQTTPKSGSSPAAQVNPPQKKTIAPLYKDQIIQPSAIDRATYQDIAKNSPTAKALLDYAQANGYNFYVLPTGGVAKNTREADAKATGYPSFGQIYMDTLGDQPSNDWALKTSPFHELVHFLQHDIHDKTKVVPPELRSMMDAVHYPYPVGPGHYQPGNESDFQARRVQNNIIREYVRNVYHREPDPKKLEVLDSFGSEAVPEGTLYGRSYPLPSKQTPTTPIAPTSPLTPATSHP